MVENKIVETVKTPETVDESVVKISYDSEGMFQLQVFKTCAVGEDLEKCEVGANDFKNKLLVGLANDKGVRVTKQVIKPKIVKD